MHFSQKSRMANKNLNAPSEMIKRWRKRIKNNNLSLKWFEVDVTGCSVIVLAESDISAKWAANIDPRCPPNALIGAVKFKSKYEGPDVEPHVHSFEIEGDPNVIRSSDDNKTHCFDCAFAATRNPDGQL